MTTPDPDHLDAHADGVARRAAGRFHDEVVGTIDLEAARSRAQRRTRRPAAVALAIAAVVAAVAGLVLVNPDSGEVEVAIDEDGTSTSEPEVTMPDIESMPTPIALGAPDDGKESVGLPVDAAPKTALTDGQMVTVTGAQFPPNQSVGVVMCTKEAGQDHGARGVDACNIGHFVQGMTDGDGNVSVEFSVRRFAMLDGQEVDCASEPGRCIIGMGLLSDYDQSGGVAVDFDPDVPAPPPPAASLRRSEGLADGETVDLSLAGLIPNSYVHVQQCTVQGACATGGQEVRPDADGTFDGSIRLWRQFGSHGLDGTPTNVDCATESCALQIHAELPAGRTLAPVPISFDPGGEPREPPTVTVLDDGPFAVGSSFSIEVSGVGRGQQLDASICPSPEQECVGFTSSISDGDGSTRTVQVEIHSPAPSCASGCPLIVSIWSEHALGESGPPPLFPETVLVTITG